MFNNPEFTKFAKNYKYSSDHQEKTIQRILNTFRKMGLEDYTFFPKEDKTIYHFTSVKSAKEILGNATLRFGEASNFNDSRDMDINIIDFDTDKETFMNYTREYFSISDPKHLEAVSKRFDALPKEIRINELHKRINETIQYVGIICFSEEPSNHLLWSHYANNERGVCIGIKMSALKNAIVSKVKYSGNMIKAKYYDLEIDALIYWGYLKSSHWAYEKEIRALCLDTSETCDENRCIPLDKNLVDEIYFGVRTPKDDVNDIINLLQTNNYPDSIKLFKMLNNPNEFNYLEPKKIMY